MLSISVSRAYGEQERWEMRGLVCARAPRGAARRTIVPLLAAPAVVLQARVLDDTSIAAGSMASTWTV
jgi:hypothetical protein